MTGHAPALIINYSGRFGSRLENEVIFLPRRQRRRRCRRCLRLHFRLRRGCYLIPIVDEKSLLT